MTDSKNAPPVFSSWHELIAMYEKDEAMRAYVSHNADLWRSIHGALAMLRASPARKGATQP